MRREPSDRPCVVAIDGPGGAGKTTVSRAVGDALAFAHLDTGAFYRAATLVAMVHRLDLANEAEVMAAVAGADLAYEDGVMSVEGIDVSAAIRSEAVTAAVGDVSALAGLRTLLVRRQRDWVLSRAGGTVVEGRDIGTVVFPAAPLKVYLTARPEVRTARRAGQLPERVAVVQARLTRRDRIDSTRRASPLARAVDAVEIDTSDFGITEVVSRILRLCTERGIR